MPNIVTAGIDLTDVAVCPSCPGGAKIYPASALDAHMQTVHSGYDSSSRVCDKCGERFTHNVNSNPDYTFLSRCRKCRGVPKGKKRGPRKGDKQKKRSKAIEFTASIANNRGGGPRH